MATNKNTCFTDDEDDQKTLAVKRVITVSSDEESNEMNNNHKRQRSSSLTKMKPLQIINKQPVIRNTRQTSLSIIRTKNDDNVNGDEKWNLKMMAPSSNESLSKQQKKKMIQTVNEISQLFKYSLAFLNHDLF
jgi:hypothetical protein